MRLGRRIGNLSLVDLPTLWNIPIGDLSIVAPRPETPDKVDLTDQQWQKNLSAKRGLTGMAILSLRGNYNADSIQERQSICLDLQLILHSLSLWLRMDHVKGRF
jgi:lipopolysaccharide/colanic/teichoic acid biosynthesis glycosyltransferase